jgi:cell division protein FtsX
MTPEEAFKRSQRRRRVTLATVIVVLVSLTAWVVELITRAK